MNKKKLIIISLVIGIIFIIVGFLMLKFLKPETYNVSFKTDGGSLVKSQVVLKGEKVEKPDDPEKDGYMFVEWLYQGKAYDFSLEVTSNLVLNARWEKVSKNEEQVLVVFDADGGTTVSNQIVKKGEKLKKPIDPKKDGYVFKGWFLNDQIYDFSKNVSKNIKLKAKWEKVVKNSTQVAKNNNQVNSNSGNANTTNKNNNSNSSNNGNGGTGQNPKPVAKNYTVTFNSNGGSFVGNQIVNEGARASRPANPARDGYTFMGWTLNGVLFDFNNSIKENIVLVASWKQKLYTVSVSAIDQYSPDRILTVYEDGNRINVSAIQYNGVTLCSGNNMVVNMYEINGVGSVTVVLLNGTSVTATVQ